MTGTHRDTICRLLVEVGDGCAKLMDEQMRELPYRRIEVDEIWAYVGKKQRHMTPLDDPRRVGDQYTFVALDPETKIVPAYLVGKRDLPTATAFITDLSERLANRVQLSSDALAAYVEATERAFGADVDYGQEVKFYEAEPVGRQGITVTVCWIPRTATMISGPARQVTVTETEILNFCTRQVRLLAAGL